MQRNYDNFEAKLQATVSPAVKEILFKKCQRVLEFVNENHLDVRVAELEWVKDDRDEWVLLDIRNCVFAQDQRKPLTLNFKRHAQ